MTPLPLAALPDAQYLLIACVVIAAIGAVGLLVILRVLGELRTKLADELRRELTAQQEGQPVRVQSPLEVKAHEGFTPLEKHEALVQRVDGLEENMNERIAGVSAAASAGREKIYNQLGVQAGLLAKNTEKTDLTFARVERLDQKIDRILERMPRSNDS